MVVQRVKKADVKVDRQVVGEIGQGLMVLIAVHADDTDSTVDWIIKKMVNLRIFSDDNGKMNLNVKDLDGEILLVSQFTLYHVMKVLKNLKIKLQNFRIYQRW